MAEEKKIKGRVNIDADDEGMLAVLHFIPDEEGSEWDIQAFTQLVSEKQIVYGFDTSKFEKDLEPLFLSSEELNITIAEGDPAEPSEPEEYKWAEAVIPDELKDDILRVLENAPTPEIYKTEIEKIKQEKVVKKKGLLPFGKEKTETVVENVKRENRIRVEIIPDVIATGLVETGEKIADIKPGQTGKPGKDVYGKPVSPLTDEDEFHLGRGIESRGAALIATEPGILRRGRNWAEVFPFRTHDWSLELSKDKNTCLLKFNPGGPESSPPDPAEIFERAKMLGCEVETLVSEVRLNEIINTAIETGKVLERAVISQDDDGFFEFKISEDKLKADLVMHKGRGNGKPLVLKQVGAAIKASGLKQMDLKKIQELLLEFNRGPEVDTVIPLCEGTAAESGEAGELVYELEFLPDSTADEIKKRMPDVSEDYLSAIESAVEYPPEEASALALVQAEQQIASLPVNEGKKGTDVYGAGIEPDVDEQDSYKALENVKIAGGIIISVTKGLLERFDRDGEKVFRIREHADSSFKIKLSDDKMTAVISAEPAVGTGAPTSLEEANRLIDEAGIKNGLNADAVRSAVEKARSGESVSGALIAMGKAPKNAGEAKLKWLIELAGGEAVTIDKSGKANYRKQNKMTSVKAGDIIAEIRVVEGESEDGWDVCGKTIAAKKLTPLNIDVGANIREEKDENGDTFLIADKSGRVLFENNRLEVQESLFIKGDVDFNTGNIKFGGDVNVKGNVKNGFFVISGGNIAIGMNSEMSLLSSEKSIAVAQGIKGGGKAILRAKDSIQLAFAERATLLAVGNITVKNAIFGCKVKCNGKLKLMSEKGYLVGGRIQAREGVEAQNIGSLSGSRTEVSFGQDYLVSDRIETEENEINKIKIRLVKIEPEMRQAEKDGEKKNLTNLRMEKVKLMKIMEKRSMRVFALKERFEQHYPGDIVIRGDVFPGVLFESHGRSLEITKQEKAVKIIFNQETGVLEKHPLDNSGKTE